MAQQPRFFRVAVEGDTTDGRKITRQDIMDCAETFNPQLYGVRVNLEHFRGLIPGGPFDMLGDVTAVKAEEVDLPVGNATQRVMALFAAINPLESLRALNQKKQKVFSSIEIGQNCRGTGKAYLVGMAVTDSPASFGTQTLEFAAQHPDLFASRKQDKANLFCQAYEIPAEVFADTQTDADPTGVFASIKGFFDRFTAAPQPEPVSPAPAAAPASVPSASPAALAADPAGFAAFGAMMAQMATSVDAMARASNDRFGRIEATIAGMAETLDRSPAGNFVQRPPATGGGNVERTDC